MKLLTVLNVCPMTFTNSFAQAAVERSNHAESIRTRSAKIIHAKNELQASGQLLAVAQVLGEQPEVIPLRNQQTLTDIAGDKSSTIVLLLPIDLIDSLSKARNVGAAA